MRRCLGRTRNLTRCNRTGDWKFFCAEHRWQPFVWVTFFIFTVIGGGASIYSVLRPSPNPARTEIHLASAPSAPKPESRPHPQVSLPQTQGKTSVPQPVIACILDEHPIKKRFLLFTVKNEGLGPAKSLSVDHLTMRYLWKEQKIKIIMGGPTNKFEYNEPGRNWLFIPQLSPNEVSSKLTGEFVWPDESTCVNILYFRVTFLTPEMASREKISIYFIEGDQIYTYAEYKTHKQFSRIDLEIKRALAEDVPNFHMLGKHKRQ